MTARPSTPCANWSTRCRCAESWSSARARRTTPRCSTTAKRSATATGPDCDFAVDPVDGTTLMSKGMPNAISVLAVAERGAMFDPSAVFYMNKIAAGPDVADFIDITSPIAANIQRIAKVRKAVGLRTSPSASWTGRGTPS